MRQKLYVPQVSSQYPFLSIPSSHTHHCHQFTEAFVHNYYQSVRLGAQSNMGKPGLQGAREQAREAPELLQKVPSEHSQPLPVLGPGQLVHRRHGTPCEAPGPSQESLLTLALPHSRHPPPF